MERTILITMLVLAGLIGGLGVFFNNDGGRQRSEPRLVIYSGRREPLILPIIDQFEKETGINVTVRSGGSQELALLLIEEGRNTEADVYIGTDAGWLEKLRREGVFAPITTERLAAVPERYRAEDGSWTGVSGRARVLIANTDIVPEEQMPQSIYDIVNTEWQGRTAMANTSNESVVTHLSAIRIVRGDAFLRDFLNGLRENKVRMLGSHTDVRQAVGRGEFAIGLVNHYYGYLQQQETKNIRVIYPDQGDGMDGVFVNVAGVGIPRAAPHPTEAQMFVEFLLTPETQQLFANLNFEFPLVEGVRAATDRYPGMFREMNVSLREAAASIDDTRRLLEYAGY